MAFSNKVMQQAIKEQMRGRVPDLQRIKREQQEAERRGKLQCRWDKDKAGRLCYSVFLEDMYGKNVKVCGFPNVSSREAQHIKANIEQYSRVHRNRLAMVSRNPNIAGIKSLQHDLEAYARGNSR